MPHVTDADLLEIAKQHQAREQYKPSISYATVQSIAVGLLVFNGILPLHGRGQKMAAYLYREITGKDDPT